MVSRWEQSDVVRGDSYDERFRQLAAAGHDVHGEASFVMGYSPATVLDAGCGTGRVGIELHRRGVEVVGVDLDRAMLETACEKAPDLEWFRADLSTLMLADEQGALRRFDVVVAAGNVMIFLAPGSERATVECLADHVAPGGLLIAGFQLTAGRYGIEQFDEDCAGAGLAMRERYSSWARDEWTAESGYVVSVHEALTGDDTTEAEAVPEPPSSDRSEREGPVGS